MRVRYPAISAMPPSSFNRDHQIGERAGQADALEEASGACGGEDEDFQASMGEKQRAKADTQDQGGEVGAGGGGRVGQSLRLSFGVDGMIAIWLFRTWIDNLPEWEDHSIRYGRDG